MTSNNFPEIITFEVDLEEAGTRLDVFASNFVNGLSRTRIQQLIEDKKSILINNKPSKNSYKLKYGDEIVIQIPEVRPLELTAENIPLDIRYEDENMLVVNKPAGMLTHPSAIERGKTLVNALLCYCDGKLSGINGIMRPGIVHRLDRDTSGLLMIAKNDFAHQNLSEQIKIREAKRNYLAVVIGKINEDSGVLDFPIDRHPLQKEKMAVVEGGKTAMTHWRVLERFDNFTFVEAGLDTGRTHQIRVHFSYINHPVAGDPIYGGKVNKINLNGQALQAYKLSFVIPGSEDRITIEIEPDDDIKKLLKILKKI